MWHARRQFYIDVYVVRHMCGSIMCSCSILDVNLYVMFKARENIQPLGGGSFDLKFSFFV